MFSNNSALQKQKYYITQFEKVGKKIGGQISNSQHGGVYKGFKNSTILFKQGRNDGETISEYLATAIYDLIIPGYASNIILAKHNQSTQTQNIRKNDLHVNVYLGTVFFKDFIEVHKIMGYKDRPLFFRSLHSKTGQNFIHLFQRTNLGRILAAALWVGDYDVHIANIGGAKVNGRHYFVKIDHGWSFAHFQDRMSFKKTPWSGHNAIGKPTNHFQDYDFYNFYQNSAGEFQKTIRLMKHIGPEDIKNSLQKAFEDISEYYSVDAYYSLAKWVGYTKAQSIAPMSLIPNLIDFLTLKLYKRATNPFN